MYESIDDLPMVCQINLPEDAQRLYRSAYNTAWDQSATEQNRHAAAQARAWTAVRERFQRDARTGQWVKKVAHAAGDVEVELPRAIAG
jgi:cation transport regulator ChaB